MAIIDNQTKFHLNNNQEYLWTNNTKERFYINMSFQ